LREEEEKSPHAGLLHGLETRPRYRLACVFAMAP